MDDLVRLSLIPGCRLVDQVGGAPRLQIPEREDLELSEQDFDEPLGDALRRLLEKGCSERELTAQVGVKAGYAGIKRLLHLFYLLHEELLLVRQVESAEGELLAAAVPLVGRCGFSVPDLPGGRLVLSRFALIRRIDGEMVAESPLGLARLHLQDARAMALLFHLRNPMAVEDLAPGDWLGLSRREIVALYRLFSFAGLLTSLSEEGHAEGDRNLSQWEFHDLLFHSRSRAGRSGEAYGATYRMKGEVDPLPALKAPMDGEVVELPRPDMGRVVATDPPLAEVMESRRSLRQHGDDPLTLSQLSELLFRTCRAEKAEPGPSYEVARRLYPGGGAAWELEIYLAVESCEGLEPGLYHYRPAEHRLTHIAGPSPELRRLLASACRAAHVEQVQVLILFGARFGRLFWKYSSMGYATVLKNVGVLVQSFYLAATAMGLPLCAIGGGDADLFAAASGIDYLEEGAVGELIVGSPVKKG